MQVHLDIPEDVAQQFAAQPGGVSHAALAALAIEGVRSGKLTPYQARQMSGIASLREMDGFLKAHGVVQPASLEDVVRDSKTAISFSK